MDLCVTVIRPAQARRGNILTNIRLDVKNPYLYGLYYLTYRPVYAILYAIKLFKKCFDCVSLVDFLCFFFKEVKIINQIN